MNDSVINVKNLSVSYADSGKGNTPLVFVHGFPFNKSTWDPQVEYFQSLTRVITYDLRGFGSSETDNSPAGMEQFADDLIAFLDALKINRVIACGLSMGGYILLNAVKKFPERFEGLILSDTQCIADNEETREKRRMSISKIENGGVKDFAKGSVKNLFHESTLSDKKEIADAIEQIIVSISPDVLVSALRAMATRTETCSSLEANNIPALIICGEDDKVTPPVQSKFMATLFTNASVHLIPKAAHLSNLEQPELFNKIVETFVKKLTGK